MTAIRGLVSSTNDGEAGSRGREGRAGLHEPRGREGFEAHATASSTRPSGAADGLAIGRGAQVPEGPEGQHDGRREQQGPVHHVARSREGLGIADRAGGPVERPEHPPRADPQGDLQGHQPGHRPRRPDQRRQRVAIPLHAVSQPRHMAPDRRGQERMDHQARAVMAEQGPRHDLEVDHGRGHGRATADRPGIRGESRSLRYQSLPVTTHNGHEEGKHELRGAAVDRGERGRIPKDAGPAQNALDANGQEGGDRHPLHPPTRLEGDRPGRKQDGGDPHGRAEEAVAMLDVHAPGGIEHVINEHVDAERGRPVRDGHPHAVGGHPGARHEQRQGQGRRQERKAVRASWGPGRIGTGRVHGTRPGEAPRGRTRGPA